MLARVAMPAVRQKRSKLAPTSCQASSALATGTTAADVVESFMALLLLRGFSTPSLLAQGEQRLPSYFNIDRDIPFEPLVIMQEIPAPIKDRSALVDLDRARMMGRVTKNDLDPCGIDQPVGKRR